MERAVVSLSHGTGLRSSSVTCLLQHLMYSGCVPSLSSLVIGMGKAGELESHGGHFAPLGATHVPAPILGIWSHD